MLIGYARTSTVDQEAGFDAQLRDLAAKGCGKVFKEQVSSVAERVQLEALLAFVRDDDVVVVTSMSRLARSMRDLIAIQERIAVKGASLRIMDLGMDTGTAAGRLTLNVLGSVAQHERESMLERQREGIARAKAMGKYKGRVPTAMRQAQQVRELAALGKKPSQIARELELGRTSVWRILRAPGVPSPV